MSKVLVIHTWGLGDMIMATPMLKSLAKSGYRVDLAITSPVNKVLLQGNDFIRNIYIIKSLKDFIRLFGRYSYVVGTAGINPQKIKIIGYLLGAKRVFAAKQQKNLHRIKMNLKIVAPLLKIVDEEPYISIKPLADSVKKRYLASEGKTIGFAPGSGIKQSFKRWGGFRELIQRVDGNKLVFIGPDEQELVKEFEGLDVTVVQESLENTISLIAHLDLLVGNDNGLMHIGYATNINTVTIYGMTNEKETGRYRENNESVFLDMECRPCFDPSTDTIGCDTIDCLKFLKVEEVLQRCQKYL